MRKLIFIFLLPLALCAQTKRVPLTVLVNTYTTAEETTLTASLSFSSTNLHIWNSTLGKARIWSGTSFSNAPDVDDYLDPAKTALLTNAAIARTNLGLGSLATQNGTFSGTSSGTNTGDQILPTSSTLSGTSLNSSIVGSSLTSIGTLSSGSIPTTLLTGNIPFANTAGSSATTTATTGTMTVSMTTPIITITPTGACTFNASGGATAQRITFVVTTSGVTSFNLTFGTNFKTTSTLATGTTTGKIFAVSFLSTNGTQWIETGRTTAQ